MQGYILNTQNVRDEDIIATILTKDHIYKTYRFYGARHSNVANGYKIDFELENNEKFLPKLHNVLHLGFLWLNDRSKLIIWQQFIRLLFFHLKDAQIIDGFYFEILEKMSLKLLVQDAKRVVVQSYVEILDYEGRKNMDFFCFLCDEKIEENVALVRGFLFAHEKCVFKKGFKKSDIFELFDTNSTIHLNDEKIDKLYDIVCFGL